MSTNPRLLLSEGTCYYGAGQLADPHFIPCGNANLEGPRSCCYEGDYCLSSNACWDNSTYVTYIAGCTDSQFRSSACPQRNSYPDQQWVALARCNGANQDIWTGCAKHPKEIQIMKENCVCNMDNQLIQNPNGKPTLDEIGLLPAATGLKVEWNPTAIPSATSTASSSSGGGGLSTGAKAGIGVGVGIGGLLLIAGALFLFMRFRRNNNQKRTDSEQSEMDGNYRGMEKNELGGVQKHEMPPDNALTEMESPQSPAEKAQNTNGYAHRSELGPGTPHGGN